jgi:integrase
MVAIKLKGIAKVTAKGRTYYYAWRGGPPLRGEPGTPAFVASYNEAVANARAPDKSRFRSLIVAYKASKDYKGLADTTRVQWAPWLDRIEAHFGTLNVAQFDRPQKIRQAICKWRSRWEDTPRTADYGMQVFSRVLSHGVQAGILAGNACEGIKALYSADRSDIIWTASDIGELKAPAAPKKGCSAEVAQAVDLGGHTGLRLSDLLRVSWSHVGEHAIVLTTGKSRHRREVIIPLYDELRAVLAGIPKRATTILTSSKGRPWKKNGFGTAFQRAKKRAGMDERDLHFHDLGRGAGGADHSPLCRPRRGHQGRHRAASAGQRGHVGCRPRRHRRR